MLLHSWGCKFSCIVAPNKAYMLSGCSRIYDEFGDEVDSGLLLPIVGKLVYVFIGLLIYSSQDVPHTTFSRRHFAITSGVDMPPHAR